MALAGYHGQNGEKNLSQVIELFKRCATVTFIECLDAESALNIQIIQCLEVYVS